MIVSDDVDWICQQFEVWCCWTGDRKYMVQWSLGNAWKSVFIDTRTWWCGNRFKYLGNVGSSWWHSCIYEDSEKKVNMLVHFNPPAPPRLCFNSISIFFLCKHPLATCVEHIIFSFISIQKLKTKINRHEARGTWLWHCALYIFDLMTKCHTLYYALFTLDFLFVFRIFLHSAKLFRLKWGYAIVSAIDLIVNVQFASITIFGFLFRIRKIISIGIFAFA